MVFYLGHLSDAAACAGSKTGKGAMGGADPGRAQSDATRIQTRMKEERNKHERFKASDLL